MLKLGKTKFCTQIRIPEEENESKGNININIKKWEYLKKKNKGNNINISTNIKIIIQENFPVIKKSNIWSNIEKAQLISESINLEWPWTRRFCTDTLFLKRKQFWAITRWKQQVTQKRKKISLSFDFCQQGFLPDKKPSYLQWVDTVSLQPLKNDI